MRQLLIIFCFIIFASPAIADETRAPLITTQNLAAEQTFQAALRSIDQGDEAAASELLQGFLFRFPSDPLVPHVRFELGRLILARYQGTLSEHLVQASSHFLFVEQHGDPPLIARARLYNAIVDFHQGHDQQATTTLRSLDRQLVNEEDSRLLLSTLTAACIRMHDSICAVESISRRLISEASEIAREPIEQDMRAIIQSLSSNEVNELYLRLPHNNPAWSHAALRALVMAHELGDLIHAAEIARALRAERILIRDAQLQTLARQIEYTQTASPRVVGMIAPMSGLHQQLGQSMIRGISIGFGLPPRTLPQQQSITLMMRDHGSQPERALRAVDELYTLHRVTAIIGPPDEPSARVVLERAHALGVPVIFLQSYSSIQNMMILDPNSAQMAINSNFENQFQSTYGEIPDRLALVAYHTAILLSHILRDGITDRTEITRRLSSILSAHNAD